jgi:hypothetical protein
MNRMNHNHMSHSYNEGTVNTRETKGSIATLQVKREREDRTEKRRKTEQKGR